MGWCQWDSMILKRYLFAVDHTVNGEPVTFVIWFKVRSQIVLNSGRQWRTALLLCCDNGLSVAFSARLPKKKNPLSLFGDHTPTIWQSPMKDNDLHGSTDPRIKHLRWSLGEDDSQCHPRTVTNDSLFLSIKVTVRNVASDPWGYRTPWHQAQYHVMVSLSRALINTRKRDHG